MTILKYSVHIIDRFRLVTITIMGPFDTESEAIAAGQRATLDMFGLSYRTVPVWVNEVLP